MSQSTEDSIVLYVRSLISDGLITCSRDLTECLDSLDASDKMRESIVAAGIYREMGKLYALRLAASLQRCREAINSGSVITREEYDQFLQEEATRLSPSALAAGFRALRIESRQAGLYDVFEAGEAPLASPATTSASFCIA